MAYSLKINYNGRNVTALQLALTFKKTILLETLQHYVNPNRFSLISIFGEKCIFQKKWYFSHRIGEVKVNLHIKCFGGKIGKMD